VFYLFQELNGTSYTACDKGQMRQRWQVSQKTYARGQKVNRIEIHTPGNKFLGGSSGRKIGRLVNREKYLSRIPQTTFRWWLLREFTLPLLK
jgi:hypothetical protein